MQICKDRIWASEHSFNDQVTSVMYRQQAQSLCIFIQAKLLTVSADILISKQGKKPAIILWAQDWLDNHTTQ